MADLSEIKTPVPAPTKEELASALSKALSSGNMREVQRISLELSRIARESLASATKINQPAIDAAFGRIGAAVTGLLMETNLPSLLGEPVQVLVITFTDAGPKVSTAKPRAPGVPKAASTTSTSPRSGTKFYEATYNGRTVTGTRRVISKAFWNDLSAEQKASKQKTYDQWPEAIFPRLVKALPGFTFKEVEAPVTTTASA